ncbi:MAG: nuclear transport factor 2 family protein [Chitinophagaceae bacterium]
MKSAILELEKQYWQAMESRDFETVQRLTHFPCMVAGKDGVMQVDEESFKKMFDSGEGKQMKVLGISNAQDQVIGDNTGLLVYVIQLEYTKDGTTTASQCACTSTWIQENGEWRCAVHTESEMKAK